jgi:hypothetical protein
MKIRSVSAGVGAAVAAYALMRPWHLRWGATDEEIARAMPLDAQVPRPTYVTNRAISIGARPEHVWPWLAQMGVAPRGGFYSYAWIERLMGMDVSNADAVLPRFQHVEAGEVIDRSGYMTVKAVEPGQFIVLGPPDTASELDSTWALALYAKRDGTTRLVSRVRARLPRGLRGLFWFALLDPGQFAMERKMLLEIKRRAEALAAANAAAGLASLGATAPALAAAASKAG